MSDPYRGTIIAAINPGLALGCISPEAADLLDRVMEAWESHKINLPEKLTCGDETWNPRESIYGFAYWLIRWSGLVQPTIAGAGEEKKNEKTPAEKEPEETD